MPVAFVLIEVEVGCEGEVLEAVRGVEGVVEAYAVYGLYDIIAKVEGESVDKIKEIVAWHIRRLDKVRLTLTMVVTKPVKRTCSFS